jgi:benzoylformate decarboxylase
VLWVSEAGSNETPISQCIRASGAFSHMSAAGGGLGFGLPAAIGAQLAAPDRPVVALIGDGSMHDAITALWTAATYRIPLTIVVASNAEYGIVKQFGALEKPPASPAWTSLHETLSPHQRIALPPHCPVRRPAQHAAV